MQVPSLHLPLHRVRPQAGVRGGGGAREHGAQVTAVTPGQYSLPDNSWELDFLLRILMPSFAFGSKHIPGTLISFSVKLRNLLSVVSFLFLYFLYIIF